MSHTLETIMPDVLGHGQSQRFEIIGEPIVFMTHNMSNEAHFHLCVNNCGTQKLSWHDITFDEFSARYPDCDVDSQYKYVTCYQWGKDGYEQELQLAIWGFIYEHFYTVEEPHFTEDIKKDNRKLIEKTLLNIIEGRYLKSKKS